MKKLGAIAFFCILSAAVYAQQAVDLGLSVKWGSCNLGASSPQQGGNLYAWGETAPKAEYHWGTYKLRDKSVGKRDSHVSKYCTLSDYGRVDNIKTLLPEDDAATQALGAKWRIPTKEEWEELQKQCRWVWTNKSGRNGYLITSRKNGNSIFLPAAGRYYGDRTCGDGMIGFYWSSTLSGYGRTGSMICFGSDNTKNWTEERFAGLSIRPVCQ